MSRSHPWGDVSLCQSRESDESFAPVCELVKDHGGLCRGLDMRDAEDQSRIAERPRRSEWDTASAVFPVLKPPSPERAAFDAHYDSCQTCQIAESKDLGTKCFVARELAHKIATSKGLHDVPYDGPAHRENVLPMARWRGR